MIQINTHLWWGRRAERGGGDNPCTIPHSRTTQETTSISSRIIRMLAPRMHFHPQWGMPASAICKEPKIKKKIQVHCYKMEKRVRSVRTCILPHKGWNTWREWIQWLLWVRRLRRLMPRIRKRSTLLRRRGSTRQSRVQQKQHLKIKNGD